ncbi:hypothetical protein [Tardiphaga sp. 768_D3_N2_1]|uniref:hypothetical protein n=1 Tax=Tardiphaga sp. 768_D3_N2_1 TaxID=3240783 RepID=UPI003F88CD58
MTEAMGMAVAASDVANIVGRMGQRHRVLDPTGIDRLVVETLMGTSPDYRAAVNTRLGAFVAMLYGRPDLAPFISDDLDFLFPAAVVGAIARCPLQPCGAFSRYDVDEFRVHLLLAAPIGGVA